MGHSAPSPLVRTLTIAALCLALLGAMAGPAAARWDWEPPTTPTGVHVTELNFTSVQVSWNPSTDNLGWVRYELKLDGPQPQLVGSMTTSRWFTVTTGGSYTVSVRAHDGANNRSPWTTPIPVEFPVDNEAPTTPTNLRATFAGGAVDEILWDASTDASGLVKYEIWSEEAGFLVGRLRSAGIEAWDLTDFHCVVYEGETHTLRVKAYDPARQYSDWSNSLTVTF